MSAAVEQTEAEPSRWGVWCEGRSRAEHATGLSSSCDDTWEGFYCTRLPHTTGMHEAGVEGENPHPRIAAMWAQESERAGTLPGREHVE